MSTTKLQAEALQWAKYLDTIFRRGFYDVEDEMSLPPIAGIPSEFVNDTCDIEEKMGYIKLEDGLSVRDIIVGLSKETLEDENIIIDRGPDDYFGYTISHYAEVIALGKTVRFLDLNLPYDKINVSRKSDHSGMYASEFTNKVYCRSGDSIGEVDEEYTHLKFAFDDVGITYHNGSYDQLDENSFYMFLFCGEDLANFKDELDAFNTIEEHISQLFLEDVYVGKYDIFTPFSTPEDVFSIDQVCPESVY